MTKPTKKALNEALKPLFKAYDRYALGLTGSAVRTEKPQPIMWEGYELDIAIARRNQIVRNVPFPFAVFEFEYRAKLDGQLVVAISGRPSFTGELMHHLRKRSI